jgi:thiol-disulfide isomerase/thioredoxin
MGSRKRLSVIVAAGLAAVALAVAVLYGTNGADVHATPPAVLDKFELTAERPQIASISFEDAKGAPVALADFRGKVLLVNLWATWCTPCVAELPDVARAEALLPKDKVAVLAINMEKIGADKVAAFLKGHEAAALPVYIDRELKVMRGFEAFGLPLTVVIDGEGREVGRAFGPQKWDHPDVIAYLRALAERPRG